MRWQDLKDLFRRAGTVLRADVALGPDNRSRGHGTVLLGSAEDAGRAVDMFNGYCWQTRVLEVRLDRMDGAGAGAEVMGVGMGMGITAMGVGTGTGTGTNGLGAFLYCAGAARGVLTRAAGTPLSAGAGFALGLAASPAPASPRAAALAGAFGEDDASRPGTGHGGAGAGAMGGGGGPSRNLFVGNVSRRIVSLLRLLRSGRQDDGRERRGRGRGRGAGVQGRKGVVFLWTGPAACLPSSVRLPVRPRVRSCVRASPCSHARGGRGRGAVLRSTPARLSLRSLWRGAAGPPLIYGPAGPVAYGIWQCPFLARRGAPRADRARAGARARSADGVPPFPRIGAHPSQPAMRLSLFLPSHFPLSTLFPFSPSPLLPFSPFSPSPLSPSSPPPNHTPH